MARGLAAVLEPQNFTVVVNVGDDDVLYGVHVSPDLDTVMYTLADVEGPFGWGRRNDTFEVMDGMAALGVDTTFRLGDLDLATCLNRTTHLNQGIPLSTFTASLSDTLGVAIRVLPATNDILRTRIQTKDNEWLSFQNYFVLRSHQDQVKNIHFSGAAECLPAPGVLKAVAAATAVVIAPSNPPLSIWPILAIPALRKSIAEKPIVIAVSPLFKGQALKGPTTSVMASLGLPAGNTGVLAAYEGLITHLVVDNDDYEDIAKLSTPNIDISAFDTRIENATGGTSLGSEILRIVDNAHRKTDIR